MKRTIRIRDFLDNQPLFKEMAAEELDRLAEGTRIVHLEKGDVLFRKGDPVAGFYVVVYGQVKLAFPSPQGTEKVLAIVGPGKAFAEALMFLQRPHMLYGQALDDTMLLHVSKEAVFAEIARDPDFALRMLAGLSERIQGLLADVESYSLRTGTQRVIGFLLTCGGDERRGDAPYTVRLPATKTTVASRLNLTPEHLSRILHDLTEAGLVRVSGRDIEIVAPQKLANHPG